MDYIPEEYTVTPQVTPSHHTTKKKRKPEEWAKAKLKEEKREIRNKGCVLFCQHKDKLFCKVRSIDIQVVYDFHKNFWTLNDAIQELVFLQKYIAVSPIKRSKQENRSRSEKKYNILCCIPCNNELIPICRESFLSILSIGRTRLENAARAIFTDDLMEETREGSKPKLEELKSKIIDHIQSFKYKERHYGKVSEFNRVYLPCELNVRKMHKMFLEKYSVPCKYHDITTTMSPVLSST